jgi:hypothetical protein
MHFVFHRKITSPHNGSLLFTGQLAATLHRCRSLLLQFVGSLLRYMAA